MPKYRKRCCNCQYQKSSWKIFKDDTKKLEYHLKNKEMEKTLASGSKVAKENEPNLMEWMKFFYKKPL